MNSVERVKAICKERKIPIYKLERDLDFGNGYIGQLKKGMFPADRLAAIAEYLSVSTDYLITGEEKENLTFEYGWFSPLRFWDKINSDRGLFMHYFLRYWSDSVDEIEKTWHVSVNSPVSASDQDFRRFLEDTVKAVRFYPEEQEWDIQLKEKKPAQEGRHINGLDDTYFSLAKELQDAQIDPEDIRNFAEIIKRNSRKQLS